MNSRRQWMMLPIISERIACCELNTETERIRGDLSASPPVPASRFSGVAEQIQKRHRDAE